MIEALKGTPNLLPSRRCRGLPPELDETPPQSLPAALSRGSTFRESGPGQPGRNVLRRASGEEVDLQSKFQIAVQAGDRLTLFTPGGGGWGPPS